MSEKASTKSCCILNCPSKVPTSNVEFFELPNRTKRSYQRRKWMAAIKNINGRTPTYQSVVCSEHFVRGWPSEDSRSEDYVPSIFKTNSKPKITAVKPDIKSRSVNIKNFALEYIKHDALLDKPSKANENNVQRKCAYVRLAIALGIPVTTVRIWEKRFRDYFEEKCVGRPAAADGRAPPWMSAVQTQLRAVPQRSPVQVAARAATPGGVVRALCEAAAARGSLCCTPLYTHVRRTLRLSSAVSDLHAVWVRAQRVSLQQVVVAGRGGDTAPPPAYAARVADLVLLHTDVDMHRLVTDESVTLYEESCALHSLWQLVQRHRLEDGAPARSRVRAQRWSRAHRDYLDSGRTASLVVLQRRWHELKLQARRRLAAHWRRVAAPTHTPTHTPTPTPDPDCPRPAPIHLAMLKRYPHIATNPLKSWRQLVLDGTIVTEPLEHEENENETQDDENEQSAEIIYVSNIDEPAEDEITADLTEQSMAMQPTVNELKVAQPMDNNLLASQPSVNEPEVDETTDRDPLAEQSTVEDTLAMQPTVNELKVEQPTELASQPSLNEPEVDETMDCDPLAEQSVVEDPLAIQRTVNELKVEQLTDNNILVLQPSVNEPEADETTDRDPLTEQSTVEDPLTVQPTVNELKVEQPTELASQPSVNDTEVDKTTERDPLAEQSMAEDPLTMQPTVNELKVEQLTELASQPSVTEPEADKPTDRDPLADQSTVEDPLSMRPTVSELKVERSTDNDILVEQSPADEPPMESSAVHASNTVSPDMSDTPDTPRRPDTQSTSSGHHAEAKSSDVTPAQQADNSDTDTDTDDRLIIDECSNKTPCSLKQEQVVNKNAHSTDTVSRHSTLDHTAPTIQVLHMIDPSTVKTEILFESDEDDFQPCIEGDKVEIELNTKTSFTSNRLVFKEEPEGLCDVKIERDVTEHAERDDQNIVVADRSTIDRKLLMDTLIRLVRIDKISAWKKNVRKDKTSIRASRVKKSMERINKQLYSLNIKRRKRHNKSKKRIRDTNVDTLIEELVHRSPNKKARSESESDDDIPLRVLKEEKEETQRYRTRKRESSSENWNEELKPRRGEKKRSHGSNRAASTIEWNAQFTPVFGEHEHEPRHEHEHEPRHEHEHGRVSKRVTLPDMAQLRAHYRAAPVAQVAPISSMDADDELSVMQVSPAGIDAPPESDELSLPADDQLQDALDGLTTMSKAEHVLEAAHCCAARRQRVINDTRRRLGFPDLPLHKHADGVCTCCCAHLCDADARRRLDRQLRALHDDIERMLWKSADATTVGHSKLEWKQSQSRATASTSAHAQNTNNTPPSHTATETKASKAKPATYVNRSKQKPARSRRRKRAPSPAPPSPEPPSPVDDYEEWQRQKNMNAQYFRIKGNFSSKKDKIATAQNTITQSTVAQSTIVQSTVAQSIIVQSTVAQSTVAQSTPAQSATAQSIPNKIAQPEFLSSTVVLPQMPFAAQVQYTRPIGTQPPQPTGLTTPPALIPIASKTVDRTNLVSEQTQQNTVTIQRYLENKPVPRRTILTTEQVPTNDSEKPLSILEEYARTLSSAPPLPAPRTPPAPPAVNALSLRASGSDTTIVMALTVPTQSVIKNTINCLYANDTVDLTADTESPHNNMPQGAVPVVDIVGAVKSLLTASNNSVMDKVPKSRSNKLHDGDVIEIDDSDSNHSSGSSQPGCSNMSSNQAINTDKICQTETRSNQPSYSNVSSNQPSNSKMSSNQPSNSNVSSNQPSNSNVSSNQPSNSNVSSNRPNAKKSYINKNKRYKKDYTTKQSSITAINANSVSRACSVIPVLMSLTDDSGRCPSRVANVAAMTDFMNKLQRVATESDKAVYWHKLAAPAQSVRALPCGGTLLCVDATHRPLVLPTPSTPHAPTSLLDHLVLTDADLPCSLPTYWTLTNYSNIKRVVPGDSSPRPHPPSPDTQICEKNHDFKVLTAFCSVEGVRQAARAGASLLLLHVRSARVLVLTVQRTEEDGRVKHHASANVSQDLLRELEEMLDKAELTEHLQEKTYQPMRKRQRSSSTNEETTGKHLKQ